MGKIETEIAEKYQKLIAKQKMFFVATAPEEGRINLSPKGLDTFRVINKNKVAWLNLTGSGNETAAHVLENGRMTIMFCAFEGDPAILRLYGQAEIIHTDEPAWEEYASLFPPFNGIRQLMVMRVEAVQKSCGFGVPLYEYKGQRDTLFDWTLKKGEDGIRTYWKERNAISIDGKKTDFG